MLDDLEEFAASGIVKQDVPPRGKVVNIRTGKLYDIYIGRGRDPRTGISGIWGNPYSHLENSEAEFLVGSRIEAILRYEEWLKKQAHLMAQLPDLHGKVLGCWCPPKPCHGSVLIRMAEEAYRAKE